MTRMKILMNCNAKVVAGSLNANVQAPLLFE